MSDDLISRQAAIDALNKMKIYRPLDSDRYVISDYLNKIVNLPSADAVSVVRCKDCRYFHENVFGDEIGMGRPYDCLIVGHCCCEFWGRKEDYSMSQTSPEGFCSFGERRSE